MKLTSAQTLVLEAFRPPRGRLFLPQSLGLMTRKEIDTRAKKANPRGVGTVLNTLTLMRLVRFYPNFRHTGDVFWSLTHEGYRALTTKNGNTDA